MDEYKITFLENSTSLLHFNYIMPMHIKKTHSKTNKRHLYPVACYISGFLHCLSNWKDFICTYILLRKINARKYYQPSRQRRSTIKYWCSMQSTHIWRPCIVKLLVISQVIHSSEILYCMRRIMACNMCPFYTLPLYGLIIAWVMSLLLSLLFWQSLYNNKNITPSQL
jgi:hypothetical protein